MTKWAGGGSLDINDVWLTNGVRVGGPRQPGRPHVPVVDPQRHGIMFAAVIACIASLQRRYRLNFCLCFQRPVTANVWMRSSATEMVCAMPKPSAAPSVLCSGTRYDRLADSRRVCMVVVLNAATSLPASTCLQAVAACGADAPICSANAASWPSTCVWAKRSKAQ